MAVTISGCGSPQIEDPPTWPDAGRAAAADVGAVTGVDALGGPRTGPSASADATVAGVADAGGATDSPPPCKTEHDCAGDRVCVAAACVCPPGTEAGVGDTCAAPDPCDSVSCGANQHCETGACVCDDGRVSTADGGCEPPPPCTAESCGKKATCDPVQQACVCKPGFDTAPDGSCVTPPLALVAPESRTEAEVCARYLSEKVAHATQQKDGGDAVTCDPGAPTRDGLDDAIRRLNLYRWLAGLPPAWDDPGLNLQEQECALMQNLHGGLDHHPTADWTCYTVAGSGAAGSSNLALGTSSMAESVDLYVGDASVFSLGHRRWCLNPALGQTAFGIFGNASCMYSFGGGNTEWAGDFVAYPSPGYFPKALLKGVWSFQSNALKVTADTVATATLADGEVVPLKLDAAGGGYGNMPSWRITVDTGQTGPIPPQLKGTVTITMTQMSKYSGGGGGGGGGGLPFGAAAASEPVTVSYTVHLVDCAP